MNRLKLPLWVLNFIEKLKQFRANPRTSRLLSFFSILYSFGLLYFSKDEIRNLEWKSFFWIFLGCIFVYYVSMSLQNLVWSLIVDGNLSRFWINTQVYFKTILMKRLPGGVWHWLGRSSMYELNFPDENREISRSNLTEWLTLMLIGLTGYATTKNLYVGIGGFIIIVVITTWLLHRNGESQITSFYNALRIILLYTVCWLAGGLILHWLLTRVMSFELVTFKTSFSVWCLSSAISMFFFFLPSGAIIRDFSLTALLANQIEPAKVALVILQVRVIFLVADFLWSFLSIQFIKLITAKNNSKAN